MQGVDAGPHEDTIIRRIFYDNHYYQSSRPVENENSAIEVKFGLSLQQIIEVVGNKRLYTVSSRLRMRDSLAWRCKQEEHFRTNRSTSASSFSF